MTLRYAPPFLYVLRLGLAPESKAARNNKSENFLQVRSQTVMKGIFETEVTLLVVGIV